MRKEKSPGKLSEAETSKKANKAKKRLDTSGFRKTPRSQKENAWSKHSEDTLEAKRWGHHKKNRATLKKTQRKRLKRDDINTPRTI